MPGRGAKLTIEVLKSTGGLEAKAIKATLSSGLAGWREQYERQRQQGIGLPKEISVSFTLDARGRVVGTPAIEESLQDQELRQSLVETLKDLQFAVPKEGSAAVTVKLVLSE